MERGVAQKTVKRNRLSQDGTRYLVGWWDCDQSPAKTIANPGIHNGRARLPFESRGLKGCSSSSRTGAVATAISLGCDNRGIAREGDSGASLEMVDGEAERVGLAMPRRGESHGRGRGALIPSYGGDWKLKRECLTFERGDSVRFNFRSRSIEIYRNRN
jgi:hypothetical protein